MAEQGSENPFSNFSIQDTIEMGMANTKLVEDFLTGSVTGSSEDISIITKETTKKEEKKATPVVKKQESQKKVENKEEEEDNTDYFSDFLNKKEGDEEEEDEEVKPKNEKKPEDKTEDEDLEENKENKGYNPFSAFSKELFKLGAFTASEGEKDIDISTPEAFLERFNEEKKKGANEMIENFLGQFGEDYHEAFQAIFINGVNPREYYVTYNNIQNFAEMDLKQESSQLAVIRQGLLDQGWETEELAQEIERLKNHGDLEPVAQRFHKVLVKKEAGKLQQMEEEKEQKRQQEYLTKQQYAKNVTTILQEKIRTKEFDGIPVNPKLAAEVQDFLVSEKYKTPSGERLTDFDKAIIDLRLPQNHDKKVKLAFLMKYLEKDPTLSSITNSAISKKSSTLFGEVLKQSNNSSAKIAKQEKPTKWDL